MKIAVLNYSYLTPKHIQELEKLGEVVNYSNTTTEKEAMERLKGVEVAIADCFELSLNKEFFTKAESLKYLCLNTTGFNLVDIATAKDQGILVSNLPGFSTEAVAEHAIGLMFAVSRHILIGDQEMHKKPFQINPARRADDMYIGTNLRGKTLGVIGLGQIGSRIAEMGKGLGMNVIAYNRTPREIEGIKMVDMEELLRNSDVITPALAYNPSLENFISKDDLVKMKKTAIIINVARGELIDEVALIEVLENKKIAGLGADVITNWSENNPLLKLDNVVLTPHMAFLTDESLKNMAGIIVQNVKAYKEGKPKNVVNQ